MERPVALGTFEFANQALRNDLVAYASALTTIVHTLPRVRFLCDQVVKETRLAQALLAFANGPQVSEIGQIVFQLRNLWPYRDRMFERTLGFSDEMSEAQKLREEAQRGIRLLSRNNGDSLSIELATCLSNIHNYLEEEQKLLETCHSRIQPHTQNMEMTRKRLDLLIAAIDARLPSSSGQQATLRAYSAAADILRDWETGVPLDERGVEILQRCIESLEQADHLVIALLNPKSPVRVSI
jgi:hypothetical protein